MVGRVPRAGTFTDAALFRSLSINDVSVAEGNGGTTPATFTVTLSGSTALPVTVSYATADGTGKVGVDYQSATGTLTFNPGETSQTIAVQEIGNTFSRSRRTNTV